MTLDIKLYNQTMNQERKKKKIQTKLQKKRKQEPELLILITN